MNQLILCLEMAGSAIYLPEELRKDEEKELAKKQGQPTEPAEHFHIPQKISTDQDKRPLLNVSENEPRAKETPLILAEKTVEPKPKLFFGKFFKLKKEPADEPKPEPEKEAEYKPSFRQSGQENPSADSPRLVMRNQAGESIDVNLIPEGTYLLSNKKILGGIFRAAALAAVVLVIAYAALTFYGGSLKNQEKSLDDQLAQKETEYKNYQGAETAAVIWQNKLQTLDGLLDHHIYWTKFFQNLEVVTKPDVYYQTIIANANGTVSLAANATDYTAVSRQFIALQQATDVFKKVEIGSLSGDPQTGSVGFNILLELQDDLFYKDWNIN